MHLENQIVAKGSMEDYAAKWLPALSNRGEGHLPVSPAEPTPDGPTVSCRAHRSLILFVS